MYLFTRKKNDLSQVPPEVASEIGDVKFLRMSRDPAGETPSLVRAMDDIIRGVVSRGYHVMDWTDRE
jgi:uncharacterized protein YcgL (UPF0745 family)